jgi:uncharacterized membrane protein required for colicin V production
MIDSGVACHLVIAALSLALILGGIRGYKEGLVLGAFKLLAVLGAFLLAKPAAKMIDAVVRKLFDYEVNWILLVIIAFFLICLAISLVGLALSKFVNWTPLAWLDRLGGVLLGLFIAIALVGLFLNMITKFHELDSVLDAAADWEGALIETVSEFVPDLFERGEDLLEPIRKKLPKELR